MKINVVNKVWYLGRGKRAIYIGRPSPLGNPFKMDENCTREQSIAQYFDWLQEKLKNKDPVVCNAMNNIAKILIEIGEVDLVCYCAPKPCHGDVIRKMLMNKMIEAGIWQGTR